MRTRSLFAVLFFVFSLSIRAASLGECIRLGEWGSRGIPSDFLVEGNRLFAADGRGITVFDVTNPASIRQLATFTTGSPSSRLVRVGSHIAVLTRKTITLYNNVDSVLNMTDEVSSSDYRTIASQGNVLLAAGSKLERFEVIEGKLVLAGSRVLSSTARAVTFVGDQIYVALQNDTIAIFSADARLDEVTEVPASAYAFAISGTTLYAAGGGNGVYVIDVTDPAAPVIRTRFLSAEANLRELSLSGNRLYALDLLTGSNVIAFDLSDPLNPRALERQQGAVSAFEASGERLYTSGLTLSANGLSSATGSPVRIFRLDENSRATFLGEFADHAGPLTGVATDGQYAYVADPPLFRVIDIRRPDDPRQVSAIPLDDSADRVLRQGSRVLVYGRGNVHIIDVEDPARPVYRGVFRALGTVPNTAAFAGPYVLEANRGSGFHVLDVTNPAVPRQTSGLKNDPQDGQFFGLVARPGVAYAFKPGGLQVIDLANPAAARVHRAIDTKKIVDAEIVAATALHPELLLVVDADMMRVFDITAPLDPVEIASLPVPEVSDLAATAENVYVTTTDGLLLRINFDDPRRPTIADTYPGLHRPTQVAIAGGRVLVADSYSLLILSDPAVATLPAGSPVTLSTSDISTTGVATVQWPSTGQSLFEVEIATQSDFTNAQRQRVFGNRVSTTLTEPLFIRVRPSGGCSESPWSNVITIGPGDIPTLGFVESGRRLILRDTTQQIDVDVIVSNNSANPVPLTLTADHIAVLVQAPPSLPARARGTVKISLPPAVLSQTNDITLRISGSSSIFRIRLSRVSSIIAARESTSSVLLLPGVAASPGSNGTNWRSSLHLFCRSSASCSSEVSFVRYGVLANPPTTRLELAAGEMLVIDDAVTTLFGESGTGAFEIRSPQMGVIEASASTYNDGGKGRFGQRVTAFEADPMLSSALSSRRLLGVVHNSRFRSNIGLVNATGVERTVLLRAIHPDGSIAAESRRTLRPWEGIQLGFSDFFALPQFDGGSILVEAAEGVAAYQSRVDQRTGDGTFSHALHTGLAIPPADLPPYVRALEVAASTPGAGNTFWRTAVHVVNEGGDAVSMRLTFTPSADPGAATTRTVALAPGASIYTDDLFAAIFPDLPPSLTYGSLRVSSSLPFTGWARLYNDGADGTYGQYVPMRELGLARRAWLVPSPIATLDKGLFVTDINARQIFPVSENSQRRTNLGFAELSGNPARLTLKIYDSLSRLIGVTERTIEPLSSGPIFGILPTLGLEGIEGLRIEIQQEGEGSVGVFASLVESSTGDAQFLSAE